MAEDQARRAPRGAPRASDRPLRPAGPPRATGQAPRSGQPRTERSAPRREPGGSARPRERAPELPEDVTGRELDREVQADLSTLSRETATSVARHLVVAGRLLDTDPEAAYAHALAAQQRAGRVGSVREATGIAAYAAGRHAEALRELRTARRLTGSSVHLPVMADCERGLGRPERALALAGSPEAAELDAEGRVELALVVAGARTDLGQAEAAVLALSELVDATATGPARRPSPVGPGTRARLLSAYADALAAAGRATRAREWLARAAAADTDDLTGARERLAALTDGPADGGAADAAAGGEVEDVVVYDLLDEPVPPVERGAPRRA